MNQQQQTTFQDILQRAFKYLIEGFAVAVAAYLIPKKKMSFEEVSDILLKNSRNFLGV